MNNKLDTYTDIVTEVLLDPSRPVQKHERRDGFHMVEGYFNGQDVKMSIYVIQSCGILNIAADFNDGHLGYDVNLFSWSANEEKIRKLADNARSSMMEWNKWEEPSAA